MLNVGDLVLTKKCSDVGPSRGKLIEYKQYVSTRLWTVLMQSGEKFLYWERELEFNPQAELFDMTCESYELY